MGAYLHPDVPRVSPLRSFVFLLCLSPANLVSVLYPFQKFALGRPLIRRKLYPRGDLSLLIVDGENSFIARKSVTRRNDFGIKIFAGGPC